MDWEIWLRAAARRPSDNEDTKRQKTEDEIRAALADYEPLRGRPYIVYAKGSYANNTNVRLNYDIDVAVEYRGYFYYDLMFDLAGKSAEEAGITPSADPYTRDSFKADIRGALEKAFGKTALETGKIAYRVREKRTTLPADVVPCWEYRRYDTLVNGVPTYNEGSRVFPSTGGSKDNYPKIQLSNGIFKNNNTGRRYKRMVRAFKKLQTRLVGQGLIDSELPSYLSECLVFNVPNGYFNHPNYKSDMREVLAYLFNGTLAQGNSGEWVEVNDLRYLVTASQSWTAAQIHAVVDAAWDAMGFE